VANWRIAKFKSHQYFFYSVSIVSLVAFEQFRQIKISPNPLFQQIAKYYIANICSYMVLGMAVACKFNLIQF